MKKHISLLLLLFLSILIQAQPARDISLATGTTGKRLAAIVGNGNYDYTLVPDLKNTLNDADSIYAALKFLGWEVLILKDGDLREMEDLMTKFYNKLNAGGYEAGLFYFSGHGLSVGGVNYLVPVDARPLSENDVKYECLDANRILGLMQGHTPLKILLLDACRDNPFSRAWTRSAVPPGLASMDSPSGTFIGFAAAPGERASDGRNGPNGLYTAALLRHLRTPGLGIFDVFMRVGKTTQELARDEQFSQTPFMNASIVENFYFRPGSLPEKEKPKENTPEIIPNHMVRIQGGWFDMGDTFGEGEDNELPVHQVRISSFLMGKHEVTFREYDEFCNATGRTKPGDEGWGRDNRPVINVSWLDAVDYCNWRSKQEGLRPVYTISGSSVSADWSANGYRLPTEAEWEYAARSRGQNEKWAGTSRESELGLYANFCDKNCSHNWKDDGKNDGYAKTAPVGSLMANSLGLYDMSGNVWEWCWDWYGNYGSRSSEDPRGQSSSSNRLLRGGYWGSRVVGVRAADRSYDTPWRCLGSIGFRLSRTP